MLPWQSRLRAQITLVAPDGTRFVASWGGDDIEIGKQVPQFNPPLFDGTITQDLGAKGWAFPLTLTFEGDNHDTMALGFARALAQRGPWGIMHPVYGQFTLQPIGPFSLKVQPTESGNATQVSGPWVEVPVTAATRSLSEQAALTSAQVDAANAAAAAQFTDALDVSDAEGQAAAQAAGLGALGKFVSSGLASLISKSADLQAQFTAAWNSATAGLQAAVWDGVNIYQQVQQIMSLPAVVEADLATKLANFGAFVDDIKDALGLNTGSDVAATNAAAMDELFLSGAITGCIQSVLSSPPATRDQALQAINDISAMFTEITAALDAVQTATAGNRASGQYFSNGMSYADLALVVSMGLQYLLRLIFDLKVARRFTLDRPRHPGEIVITEYAPEDSSTYDDLYDLFIASNGLIGDDIVLLPAGREVVVYQ